jgi:YVTN family beta-propeller protein
MVYVIDTVTNALTTTIALSGSSYFHEIAMTGDGARAYLPNYGDNTVAVLDTTNGLQLTTISCAAFDSPYYVAITDPRAYITNVAAGANSIAVIDTTTDTVVSTILVDSPRGLIITPDGAHAYVANHLSSGTVSVIQLSGGAIRTVPVGRYPGVVAISPNGSKVYVGCDSGRDPTLYVISTATNTVSGKISLPLDHIISIAFTPDGSSAYVAGYDPDDCVAHINVATDTFMGTIATGSSNTYVTGGLAVVPQPTTGGVLPDS